jgi:6-phosphogluconolactonase
MKIEVLADSGSVAQMAADTIAEEAGKAIGSRGLFLMAVSGGHTPWVMLRELAAMEIPWSAMHIFQVDERVAPAGHTDRNLTHLLDCLRPAPIPPEQIYPMPVEATDLEAAAAQYANTLERIGGVPPVLDFVHLGLGPDGHTASLVPGDRVLDIQGADVGLSGPYQERRRMTLTYPILNRARRILWVVTGSDKAPMVDRLLDGDSAIPAGRVSSERALLLADSAAAGQRGSKTGGALCV